MSRFDSELASEALRSLLEEYDCSEWEPTAEGGAYGYNGEYRYPFSKSEITKRAKALTEEIQL